jgi:hypothetical protein
VPGDGHLVHGHQQLVQLAADVSQVDVRLRDGLPGGPQVVGVPAHVLPSGAVNSNSFWLSASGPDHALVLKLREGDPKSTDHEAQQQRGIYSRELVLRCGMWSAR